MGCSSGYEGMSTLCYDVTCSRLFLIALSVCDASVCATADWAEHTGEKYVLGGFEGGSEGVGARCSSGSRRGWRSPESATQAAFLTLIATCNVFTSVFLCTGEGVCLVPSPFGGVCLLSCSFGGWLYLVPCPFWGWICLVPCHFWGVSMPGTFPSPGRYTPEGITPRCWRLVVAAEADGTDPTGILSCMRSTSATADLENDAALDLPNECCELHRFVNHKSLESSASSETHLNVVICWGKEEMEPTHIDGCIYSHWRSLSARNVPYLRNCGDFFFAQYFFIGGSLELPMWFTVFTGVCLFMEKRG